MKIVQLRQFKLILILITALFPLIANANQSQNQNMPYQEPESIDIDSGMPGMQEMVVTATRTEERAIDVPVYTEVITREMIEMSGATHLGDLMSIYITGMYYKLSNFNAAVGLRGFRTSFFGEDINGKVLILVDGHRIGTGNAAWINLDRIERIEVTKGPASALYGSAAMGGVVNLITQKGDDLYTTNLNINIGSFDYNKGSLSTGGKINDRLQLNLSASYEDIYTGYYSSDNPPDDLLEGGWIYASGVSKDNIGGNFSFDITDQHKLRLGGSQSLFKYYHTDDLLQNADIEYNADFMEDRLHWRGLFYYIKNADETYDVRTTTDEQSGEETTTLTTAESTDTILGMDQQLNYFINDSNTLLFGFSSEVTDIKSERYVDGQPTAHYDPNFEYNSYSLFIQDALDFWQNRINIIAAARYDRYDTKARKSETDTSNDFTNVDNNYDHISPKIGGAIKFLDEKLRIRANFGEGFKSPSTSALGTDAEYFGVTYQNDPDLEPEISRTYDVGADIFHPFFTISTAYFHTDYKDKIELIEIETSGSAIYTYKNRGEAEIAGFDLNLDWNTGRTFHWDIDLSLWTKATVNTTKKDKLTDEDLTFISDYEVKSGLNFIKNNFKIQVIHVLVGPQAIQRWDSVTMEEIAPGEKDSFDLWDLTFQYQFKNNWQLKASIFNLLNERIEWVDNYLAPKRNYHVGFSYTF